MTYLTLGKASQLTGKSKPTISKAVKDGKLSGQKVNGVFQIERSELLRVYPAKASQPEQTKASAAEASKNDALLELKLQHLEEKLRENEERMRKLEDERDQAIKDARDDRTRFMALLEHQQPKSMWQRIRGK